MYLNSVNYFTGFCESDGGNIAFEQNIPRAKCFCLNGAIPLAEKCRKDLNPSNDFPKYYKV